MTVKLLFSEAVPAWTKLGTAEFFRLLEYPQKDEIIVAERAKEIGIEWEMDNFSLIAENETIINDFLIFVAKWYTRNRLTMISNYDLVLKHLDMTNQTVLEPTPRPASLRYIPSNSSNIKPPALKEINIEGLPQAVKEKIELIKKNGLNGIQPDKIKNAKIYPAERYIEFSVIQTSGKKGHCFACSKEDYLMLTKETQSPLTVGLANYSNFYSYHSGNIGFCRTCSISNHLAFGRVLYNVSDDTVFLAIPESSSINDLVEFIGIIEMSYPVTKFIRSVRKLDSADSILIGDSSGYFSNFVEKGYRSLGFYFLIIVMFNALLNSINTVMHNIQDKDIMKEFESNELFKFLMKGSIEVEKTYNNLYSTIFKSWSFILSSGDQKTRYWRYVNSEKVVNLIRRIKEECGISNPLDIIQKLIYKSGSNYIDIRREDFCRSILLGQPEIGLLEEAVWDIMAGSGRVGRGISDLATCVAKWKFEAKNMESEDILKQCRMIGRTIAELAADENSKALLYELRSVGNPQALRYFIERFTFKCAFTGKQTLITNDFVTRLFEGTEWNSYKSIIAIVANQHYSYINSKKEVPAK